MPSRRQFLSAGFTGLLPKSDRAITGGFLDDGGNLGHRLRERHPFPAPRREQRVPLVIVGGGIAGLTCAWHLRKRGFTDFVLLEMEGRAGGNARWGENEITPFPWAAHYLPVPGPKATLVRELCTEFGLLRDGHWEERHLCHSPQERLFLHGRWQEGIEPELAATRQDREDFRRFRERVAQTAASGEFTVPLSRGAPRESPLDRMTLRAWLDRERLHSPYLRWYVDYACRDDYGALASGASAWAGLHYFAARDGDDRGPLTWPEGNGWLTRQLLQRVEAHVRTGALVHSITREPRGFRVAAGDTSYQARAVVFAAPSYLAPYLIEGWHSPPGEGFLYSPWLTANLTLDRMPQERGIPPAWDNVIYGSPALGYVVATHQSVRTRIDRTVWTYYWALAQGSPVDGRRILLSRDWGTWKEAILNDLARAHPDIRACVSRIDILRLGHAMPLPSPGFLSSPLRARLRKGDRGLFFAHSDVSGLPLFEEALDGGVRAAGAALAVLA